MLLAGLGEPGHRPLPRLPRFGRSPEFGEGEPELGQGFRLAVPVADLPVRLDRTGTRRMDATSGATIRMNVTRVVAKGRVMAGGGKSRTSRRPVALDQYTAAALREHLDRLGEERKEFGTGYQDGGRVFCWPDGTRIYPDTVTEKFNALVDRAKLPPITLHDVRHSYAIIALRSGVHPKIVSSRLGHASVAFTLQTYTEDIPDLDRDAAESIGGLFLPRPDGPPDEGQERAV